MSNINVNNITPLAGTTGRVSISGSLFVTGSITAEGHINLGDSDLDSIYFGAEVSSSILPNADNTYDLGSSTKEWKDIYVDGTGYIDAIDTGVSIPSISSSIEVSGSIIPHTDDVFDLGSSTREWKDLYIDGQANIDTGSIDMLAVTYRVSSSLTPFSDNTYDLGSAVKRYGQMHTVTASFSHISSSGTIKIENSFLPNIDSTIDLGSKTFEWKDLFIDGVASIDTLSNIDSGSITLSSSLIPPADATYDLGHVGARGLFNNYKRIGLVAAQIASASHVRVVSEPHGQSFPTASLIVSGAGLGHVDVRFQNLPTVTTGDILVIDSTTGAVKKSTGILSVSGSNVFITGSLTLSGSSTFTNWGNWKGRMHQDRHFFQVSTNPYVDGGWRKGLSTGTPALTGSAPHLHFALSGSGKSGIGTLDPQHTWHVSSSSPNFNALYVEGTTAFDGYISSSIIPFSDNEYDLGSSTREWNDIYIDGIASIDTLANKASTVVNVSSSLVPSVDDTFNLGSSTKRYQNAHAYTASVSLLRAVSYFGNGNAIYPIGSILVSGSLIPQTDDKWDLGGSANQWQDLYVDGVANIDTIGNVGATSIAVSGSLISTTDNTFDLGSTTTEWKDLYIDGMASIDTLANYSASNQASTVVNVSSSLVPSVDDTFDLGSSTKEWKDLYIDGVANIDTLHNIASGSITLSSSLIPSEDATYDLGLTGAYFAINKRIGLVAAQVLSASFTRIVGEPHGQSFPTASLIVSGAGYGNVHVRFQDLPDNYTTAYRHGGSGSLFRSGSTLPGGGSFLCIV